MCHVSVATAHSRGRRLIFDIGEVFCEAGILKAFLPEVHVVVLTQTKSLSALYECQSTLGHRYWVYSTQAKLQSQLIAKRDVYWEHSALDRE